MEREEELLDLEITSTFTQEEPSDEVDFEEEKIKSFDVETAQRNEGLEVSDGYESEIKAIIAEEQEENNELLAKDKEIDAVEEEIHHEYIQHGLAMKGFINPQHLIGERKEWKTFYDFITSKHQDKKALEVLFYSNSLTHFLGEHYLENYVFDDLLCIYKHNGGSFFKELLNTKTKKKALSTYKKNYISPLKFSKIKKAKKSNLRENSLFWNDFLSAMPSFDMDADQASFNKESLISLLDFSNQSSSLLDFWKEKKNIILTNAELQKNYISLINHRAGFTLLKLQTQIDKLLWDKIATEFVETEETTIPFEEIYNEDVFNEEMNEVVRAYQLLPEPHPLNNVEKNYNIQKYLETIGFMDNSVWEHLKAEYKVPAVQRVTSLIKYISGNSSSKLEVMERIIPDKTEFQELKNLIQEQENIEALRLHAKKALLPLTMDEIAIILTAFIQKNKAEAIVAQTPNLISVKKIIESCWMDTKNCDLRNLKQLQLDLSIVGKVFKNPNIDRSTLSIDDLPSKDKEKADKITLNFSQKVKSILIELLIRAVNEYLQKFKKENLYKKFYTIKTFGYVSWKNMFEKGKALLYLREKWEYACSVYGMSSQLFTKLRGLGTFTLNINWNGDERINRVQYHTLGEKTLKDFEETLIQQDQIKYFKNFKKKLLLYSKILDGWDWEKYHNTLKNLDANNTFLFFNYEEKWDEVIFFFSDGEISVKLSKDDYFALAREAENTNENKDFVNTTKIIDQKFEENKFYGKVKMYNTKVQWIDADGKTQKDNVYTNIRCNVWYNLDWPVLKDFFENWVHKWLLSYYFLYYHKLFNPKTKEINFNGRNYKGIVVFDLETIWFTGNIILSYFLVISYKTVVLYKYSHKEFGNFFEVMAEWDIMYEPLETPNPDKPFGEERGNHILNFEEKIRKWTRGDMLISGHNTLNFDNKKIAEDLSQDKTMQLKIKEQLDNNTIDVLAVLMQAWYGRLWLDFLSKINFDFGKNIKKWWKDDLMNTILTIQWIIKMPEWEAKERAIKKNYWLIHKFIVYNKNDVLMSMGLLGQLMAYGMLATGKRLAHISPEQLAISLK